MQMVGWWALQACQQALQLWFDTTETNIELGLGFSCFRSGWMLCCAGTAECGLLLTLNLTPLWLATKMPARMVANWRHLELEWTCSLLKLGVCARLAGCWLAQTGQMLTDWWCAGTEWWQCRCWADWITLWVHVGTCFHSWLDFLDANYNRAWPSTSLPMSTSIIFYHKTSVCLSHNHS